MIKKVGVLLMTLVAGMVIPLSSFANSLNEKPVKPDHPMKIVLTPAEHADLKTKGKLPKEPFEVREEPKVPKNAKKIIDPLRDTKLGQKLVEEYGEDLKKEIQIDENTKVVKTIKIEAWDLPADFQPEQEQQQTASLLEKIDSTISNKACAACPASSKYMSISLEDSYYENSVKQLTQWMTVKLYEQENEYKMTHYKHAYRTTMSWYRVNSNYTVKNADMKFAIMGTKICTTQAFTNSSYWMDWTPSWKDSNWTYTYEFWGDVDYMTWPAVRESDDMFTRHQLTSDGYKNGVKLRQFDTNWDKYN